MFDNRDRSKAVFSPFASEEVSPPFSPHWEAKRRAAEALRALTETLVTSDADTEGLNALAQRLERESAALGAQPRLYGLEAFIADGKHGGHGEVNHELNALGGWSNPLSPALNMWLKGREAFGTVRCGYAYEGPPGFIHGGFIAAIFDQFLGMAQLAGNNPGMTGTLTVRYHRPTPLNTDLSLRATLQGSTGRKTVVTGEMLMAGEVTASCEGLFIRPQKALLSTP
ncbi:MAG: thioesterase [Haliea sp.]|uniref:PaaI family thioesterase n=1 Tax=Haliea sp. TaxID=1932666 RepID=UPI000C6A983D|nr:PaaI family thioesterase [Haliea sp.]MBM68416.1 thioesterase [Haliea sp.]|tara:strand:+ start:21621 stop:22298 length:678 start_codon:yes stop_codon:yes gene_type:complete